jgi:lipoprotein NlpI
MIYLNYKHLYYFQAVAQEGSIAQYYLSQFDLAELDMNKAIEVDTGKWEPNDLYRKLWIFLAQEKKNKSGRAYIKSFRGELKRNHWPDSLFLLYTGEMTVDQLQVIPKKRDRTQLCQAHFYTGVFHKMERRYEEAKTAFEDAQKPAEDCIEMHAAEFELADLTSRE